MTPFTNPKLVAVSMTDASVYSAVMLWSRNPDRSYAEVLEDLVVQLVRDKEALLKAAREAPNRAPFRMVVEK